ncbi:MAG: hypothetical protein ALECFALPRED_004620 [Alectoria fallacina]|uniref:1-alkyl-2-acetylglycerophosphocholine esterase n=1 Tax=Alectoria fallacina TaxID=1903189 RepID=A0A8H3FSW8_9LECA|nr:MAG: hypothetical protein ALECFALPRED_004620 [Alectoria fallacina]
MVDSDMDSGDYVVHKITGVQKCKIANHGPPERNAAGGGFKVKNKRTIHQKEKAIEVEEANDHADHWEKETKCHWDVANFIFPEQNPFEIRPNNAQGLDEELRSAQIEIRLAEIEEAYDIFKAIAAGTESAVSERCLRNAGGFGAFVRGLDSVEQDSWKGKVNTTQETMISHSFGAATTVEILRHAERFQWIG